MKATYVWPGALLLAGAMASLAHAQVLRYPCSPVYERPLPTAPDCRGPGFFYTCPRGTTYGPNYYLRPWWDPTTPICPQARPGQPGCIPGMPGQLAPPPAYPGMAGMPGMQGVPGAPARQATLVFPTHPFARSPRDFFMVD
jgi:hypothetical protein